VSRFLQKKLRIFRSRDEWFCMQKKIKKLNEWYVYIVECSDTSYYTGITKDVFKRIREHNLSKKGAKYTRSRRPVKLIVYTCVNSQSEALKLELKIKTLKRSKKINYLESYRSDNGY